MAKEMVKAPRRPSLGPTRADFKRLLGELDEPTVLGILEVDPTLEELEEAAICLTGDQDVLAKSGHHVSPKAGRVVEIITSAEEEDAPRSR
jgi:hypothetical protein